MIKKVIDIIPPITFREDKFKQVARAKSIEFKKKVGGKKSSIFVLVILILIGIFSYAYFVLPKAEIKIWPKTELLTIETELIIRVSEVSRRDKVSLPVGKEIPGEVLESVKRIDQKFLSSDKFLRETRAEGIIRLYNNYSTASQSLIPRTRFMSACGKTFRTPVRVVIPGKRREAGVWVPGTIDIRVIADQPGNEFNIDPTAFSIPGFAGLARFISIYGRSYKPMTGGEIRQVVQVSQEDLDLAENILIKKAADVCLADLKIGRDNQGISILKEAVEMNILESFANVGVGAEVEEFTFQIKVNCRTIGFEKEKIKKFALDFLNNQISENKLIVPESLKVDYSLENIDIDKGEMDLSLNLTARVYSVIDQLALRKELTGKSLIETRAFLENLPQISKVDVDFWPFWVKSVPENLERVIIEFVFE